MKDQIDPAKIPAHIAVIMDGNGRWAKKKGAARIFGHRNAIKAVREISEGCAELGVQFLTLYAFSTENWNRPKEEVNALMQLLVSTIRNEMPTLNKNNIRLQLIGDAEMLPKNCVIGMDEAMRETAGNTGMTLVLALSYGGRNEILTAVRRLAEDVKADKITAEQIDDELFAKYLYTDKLPDPDLMIRTSGELRLSNFLLWQLAYSEFFFTDVLWPDFRKNHLHEAILSYQKRDRRFGKTEDQASSSLSS